MPFAHESDDVCLCQDGFLLRQKIHFAMAAACGFGTVFWRVSRFGIGKFFRFRAHRMFLLFCSEVWQVLLPESFSYRLRNCLYGYL